MQYSSTTFPVSFAALALEQIQLAVFLLDSDLKFTVFNREAERLTGLDRAWLLGRRVWDAFPDVLGTRIEHAIRQAASPRISSKFEYYYSCADRWLDVQVDPMEGGIIVTFRNITENKRLKEQLARSEDILALMLESQSMGTFRWCVPDDEVTVSPEVYALCGLPPGELKQKSAFWGNYVHPGDYGVIAQKLAYCFERNLDSVSYEFRFQHGGGSWRTFHARARIAYDAKSQPFLLAGIVLDITDLREMEAALEQRTLELGERVEELEAVLDCAPVGIAISRDPECRQVRLNPELARMLGVEPGTRWPPEGEHPVHFTCDGRKVPAADFPLAVAAEGERTLVEVEIECLGGTRRPVLLRTAPLFRQDGGIRGAVVTAFDTTELRAADAKIEESSLQLRRLVESNTVGIGFGTGERLTEANDLYLKILGRTREDLEQGGIDLEAATPPEFLEITSEHMSQLRKTGSCPPFEKEYLRSDGSRVPVLVGGAALSQEPEVNWIRFAVDLSTQKILERELRQANRELAKSNQNLQRFAYVVAHDLQAPLRTVSTMTEMLLRRLESRLDPESSEIAGFVQSSVKQMSALISNLLAYSKIGADTEQAPSVVDTNVILNGVLELLEAQIAETGARVTSDPLPQVKAGGQLVRVFQNLIENALKYRSDAPPRIHVSAERRGEKWLFSVQDNGVGFDMKYAEKIFEVFYRLHRGERQGTGIGLAICRKLIQSYGGDLYAESEPGVGSKFYFTLPDAEEASRAGS
jgi:PAS domain S-box-containing protein